MADAGDEAAALREMAANRGFRLARSRRRKPGGDFGRYGLTDAKSGMEIFGFGKGGLEASAEEIADFLRKRILSTWESSLGAVGRKKGTAGRPAPAGARSAKAPPAPRRSRKAAESAPPAARGAKAPAAAGSEPPAPAASPALRIRVADAVDGEAIAGLFGELGIKADADEISDRIGRLSRMGEPVIVARLGDAVAGCLTWHIMTMLHRPRPVGRITLLAVAANARRQGIGRALVEAAEARFAQRGCGLVEVTSNSKLRAAHAFYRRLGYESTSRRLAKPLEAGKAG